jgi:hypothetical protein
MEDVSFNYLQNSMESRSAHENSSCNGWNSCSCFIVLAAVVGDSPGSEEGDLEGCCECGDEPSGSGSTELVRYFSSSSGSSSSFMKMANDVSATVSLFRTRRSKYSEFYRFHKRLSK